ncbi:MAG: hypothetical protein EPO61_12200 [Nitrospirae bacterium]|nr:MAG: hypothetical protein EPO61_12200 [Nitrospirota bacterium]
MFGSRRSRYVPGSKVRVWDGVFHYGIIDWPMQDGTEMVLHSRKGCGVERTILNGFAQGKPIEVGSVPQSLDEQASILRRARRVIGKPYSLIDANCEHFANWAISGQAFSWQIAVGVLVCLVCAVAYVRSDS